MEMSWGAVEHFRHLNKSKSPSFLAGRRGIDIKNEIQQQRFLQPPQVPQGEQFLHLEQVGCGMEGQREAFVEFKLLE
jgi:hypothetical protein